MKKVIKILVILIVVIIVITTAYPIHLDTFFISSLYTVMGIMFSIGLSLVVTFNMGNVKNKTYVQEIRYNLNRIRKKFILYFLSSTVFYIVNYYIEEQLKEAQNKSIYFFSIKDISVQFDFSLITCIIILYSIAYIIINFMSIQKLNNDIFDMTNKSD